jgi:flagellar motor switch protein FliM
MSNEITEMQNSVDSAELRSLRALHERAGDQFAGALSAMLRCPIEVALIGFEPVAYGRFVQSLESPSCFHVLKAEPLADRMMLDIDPAILYPMLDRMLGGGQEDGPPPRRAPSDIELPLVARIVRLFLDELHAAWLPSLDLTFDVLQVESHPRFLRVLPSDEPVVAAGFRMKVGQWCGMMRLCLPCRAIQEIRAKQADAEKYEAAAERDSEQGDSQLEMRVTLAETTLTADELRGLRVGDIIVTETDADAPVSVSVGEEMQGPHFLARVGACRGRKAVRISENAF